jgi:quinoprotein glucose dehydrogenase
MWDYDLPAPPALVTIRHMENKLTLWRKLPNKDLYLCLIERLENHYFQLKREKFRVQSARRRGFTNAAFPVKTQTFCKTMDNGSRPHRTILLPDHDSLVKKFRSMRYEGLYTPPDLKRNIECCQGTRGGGEWGGAAFDPATNLLYIKSNDAPDLITIVRGTKQASTEQVTVTSQLETVDRHARSDQFVNSTGYRTWKDPSGNPAITPPWGTLNALNLATGEYEWQIPLGNDSVRQHKGAPETGQKGKLDLLLLPAV